MNSSDIKQNDIVILKLTKKEDNTSLVPAIQVTSYDTNTNTLIGTVQDQGDEF